MSLARSLGAAFTRSVDQARLSLASALRFTVSPPTTANDARIPIYGLASAEDIKSMATGCDADIGGLSSARIDLDPQEGKGRFWGTLSSEIPRTAKIERSGYAGFRNRNRPTLFGSQTWDMTMHQYLCLKVRNRLAKSVSQEGNSAQIASSSASLRSALSSAPSSSSSSSNAVSARQKAIKALALDLPSKPGPKFYVNVQTDGPVTSDLFQHRLLLDDSKGDAWQEVIIPLSDFVLLNTGQITPSQISMMREKIRTVGISVMLEHPAANNIINTTEAKDNNAPPDALRQKGISEEDGDTSIDDSSAQVRTTPVAVKRRGASYNFDIGVDTITAISEEGLSETRL